MMDDFVTHFAARYPPFYSIVVVGNVQKSLQNYKCHHEIFSFFSS